MNKIYIIRHGRTDWNDKKLMQGRVDTELNEEGITKTKELINKLDLDKIDICFCSPLKRARQTADILVSDKLKIIYDDLLIERNFGDYEGKPIDENVVKRLWNYELNDSNNNVEPIKECLERSKVFLEKIKKEYKDKTILIITHYCTVKTLHFNIVGYNQDTDLFSFNPKNSIIYEYEI